MRMPVATTECQHSSYPRSWSTYSLSRSFQTCFSQSFSILWLVSGPCRVHQYCTVCRYVVGAETSLAVWSFQNFLFNKKVCPTSLIINKVLSLTYMYIPCEDEENAEMFPAYAATYKNYIHFRLLMPIVSSCRASSGRCQVFHLLPDSNSHQHYCSLYCFSHQCFSQGCCCGQPAHCYSLCREHG